VNITCQCGHQYSVRAAPCPDGIEGCLVFHTDKESYICPKCGTDNVPRLVDGVSMEIGPGTFNAKSLSRLDLFKEDRDV